MSNEQHRPCYVAQMTSTLAAPDRETLSLHLTRRLGSEELRRVMEWLQHVDLAGVLEFPK